MTINIIDPHIHLFDRTRGEYHWLKSENPPFWPDKSIIQQDFVIDDLTKALTNNLANGGELADEISLTGFVHIEAGFDNDQPWRELEYLDDLALGSLGNKSVASNSTIFESSGNKPFRTIASIDLLATDRHFSLTLKKLHSHNSLVGVRHILDEQAYDILSSQQAQYNFSYLNEITDFIFELQLPLADLNVNKVMPLLVKTISQNSQLRFIINHAGFPPKELDAQAWDIWQSNINELAKHSNVYIKCSGMEMLDRQYQMSWFSAITSLCIEKFSTERVMLASNFPLCLLGKRSDKKLSKKSYANYWQDILQSKVIKQLCEKEKSALLYNNALRIYQLTDSKS